MFTARKLSHSFLVMISLPSFLIQQAVTAQLEVLRNTKIPVKSSFSRLTHVILCQTIVP